VSFSSFCNSQPWKHSFFNEGQHRVRPQLFLFVLRERLETWLPVKKAARVCVRDVPTEGLCGLLENARELPQEERALNGRGDVVPRHENPIVEVSVHEKPWKESAVIKNLPQPHPSAASHAFFREPLQKARGLHNLS
jgi:hypothetical protein